MTIFKKVILPAAALLLASNAFGQFAATGTTNLSVTVASESALQVNTASTLLAESGGLGFTGNYTGTTSLTYKLRTKTTSGTGSITVKITTDFTPTGGPA